MRSPAISPPDVHEVKLISKESPEGQPNWVGVSGANLIGESHVRGGIASLVISAEVMLISSPKVFASKAVMLSSDITKSTQANCEENEHISGTNFAKSKMPK